MSREAAGQLYGVRYSAQGRGYWYVYRLTDQATIVGGLASYGSAFHMMQALEAGAGHLDALDFRQMLSVTRARAKRSDAK